MLNGNIMLNGDMVNGNIMLNGDIVNGNITSWYITHHHSPLVQSSSIDRHTHDFRHSYSHSCTQSDAKAHYQPPTHPLSPTPTPTPTQTHTCGKLYMAPSVNVQVMPSRELKASVTMWARLLKLATSDKRSFLSCS